MAEVTKIQWTDHTFNAWRGCTKISPGCTHCYAEVLSRRNPRTLGVWGDQGTRAVSGESYWRQPLKWDRAAAKAGVRRRVFCAGLADVFEDRDDLVLPLARLLRLIHLTPNLDWQLLTKRADGIRRRLEAVANLQRGWNGVDQDVLDGAELALQWVCGSPLPNIWLGVSVEDQQRAEKRIPLLLSTPAAVRFVSAEPLLGPVDLSHWLSQEERDNIAWGQGPLLGYRRPIDWTIVGGESGPQARPCSVHWVRDLVKQCRATGVACFVKQLGAKPYIERWQSYGPVSDGMPDGCTVPEYYAFRDRKGGASEEWPADLRVREFPEEVRR